MGKRVRTDSSRWVGAWGLGGEPDISLLGSRKPMTFPCDPQQMMEPLWISMFSPVKWKHCHLLRAVVRLNEVIYPKCLVWCPTLSHVEVLRDGKAVRWKEPGSFNQPVSSNHCTEEKATRNLCTELLSGQETDFCCVKHWNFGVQLHQQLALPN